MLGFILARLKKFSSVWDPFWPLHLHNFNTNTHHPDHTHHTGHIDHTHHVNHVAHSDKTHHGHHPDLIDHHSDDHHDDYW